MIAIEQCSLEGLHLLSISSFMPELTKHSSMIGARLKSDCIVSDPCERG
jgi:hypothetical protein